MIQKKLFILFSILFASSCFGQIDTSTFRQLIIYVKSESFRTTLVAMVDKEVSEDIKNYPNIRKRAKAYRNEVYSRRDFWLLPDRCFEIDSVVFKGRVSFSNKDTFLVPSRTKDNNLANCIDEKILEVYFLDNGQIDLAFYEGGKIGGKRRFGNFNIVRFKLVGNAFELVEMNFLID